LRYFIELSFLGKDYNGWQIQKNGTSVEEVLENCLSILLKKSINIIGAARTDKGVHAKQIFAHFDFNGKIHKNFLFKMNCILPDTIKIIRIFKVKNNIHARFSAISRTYEYHISLEKDPFSIGISWICQNISLDLEKMNESSKILMKYNDFSSFFKKKKNNNNNKCIIYQSFWFYKKKKIIFIIKANRFLRNMVRSIVGTIIDVGKKKISLKEFNHIILSKKRKYAKDSVPPFGLFLTKISYPKDIYL
jgi:tRNA pseudouridine38-40 synthase